jgi:hypothetical protein
MEEGGFEDADKGGGPTTPLSPYSSAPLWTSLCRPATLD